jgi:hypothetical protein
MLGWPEVCGACCEVYSSGHNRYWREIELDRRRAAAA